MWESENQDESPLMTTDNFHGIDRLVAGDKSDLKVGAHVFIPRWEKQADGTWQATVARVVSRRGRISQRSTLKPTSGGHGW